MTLAMNLDSPAGEMHYEMCESNGTPSHDSRSVQEQVAQWFAENNIVECKVLGWRGRDGYCANRQKNVRHEHTDGRLRAAFAACKDCPKFHRQPDQIVSTRFNELTEEGYEQANARLEELRAMQIKKDKLAFNPVPYRHGPAACSKSITPLQVEIRAKLINLKNGHKKLPRGLLAPMERYTGYCAEVIREYTRGVYKGNNQKVALALKSYFEKGVGE